jgi:hypothetical protein
MRALTTEYFNHGTHGTHGKRRLSFRVFGVFCGLILSNYSGERYFFIPLAGREPLLRQAGYLVSQDCSAEGPRESQGGSQPVQLH